MTAQPDRVVDIHHTTIHQGKTVIWNRGGIHPRGCHVLEIAARRTPPQSCGEGTQTWSHTAKVGVPVGRPEFTQAILQAKTQELGILLDRITAMGDLQSAWCILLSCASARANFWLRTVRPDLSGEFAREHDASLWRCMCQLLHVDPAVVADSAKAAASLPLAAGGLGLRSAERLRHAAHWGQLG